MDRRQGSLYIPTTRTTWGSSVSPLPEPLEICSTAAGSEQCGSPRSSLAGSVHDSSLAVLAVLPMDVFGRSKDAAPSTTLNQLLVKRTSLRIPKANEQRESDSGVPAYKLDMLLVSKPPSRRTKRYDEACGSRDACRPTRQQRGGELRLGSPATVERLKSSNSVGSTHYKAVDPIPLQATPALPPIPTTDISPVIHDDFLQVTEVASTDDSSQDTKVAAKDDNSQDTEVASTDGNSRDTEVASTDDYEESRFRQRKLEQIFQALPHLMVIQHHPSGSKPSRFSKQPSYNKRAHADPSIKTSVGPSRSRTPHVAAPDRQAAISNSYKVSSGHTKVTTAGVPSSVILSGIGQREDKLTVAKNAVKSGKSITVRNEPKQVNSCDTTKCPIPSCFAKG